MPTTSRVLPVSILTGPSARALVQDVISRDVKCRFGLLAISSVDSQPIHDQLMVESLVTTNGGGHEPGAISAQISAIANKALVDHLLVECDSKTHPIAFASLFLPDGDRPQHLSHVARLGSIVLAIDSNSLLDSIVHGRRVSGVTSPCILADQIECADAVVLGGEPSEKLFMLARAVLSALNPRAKLIEGPREMTPFKLLDDTLAFDFEAAFAGAGWRKLMDEEPGTRRDDRGVTTFMYRSRRPFHPEKFWNLLQSPFPGVFRAKGFFWLATRMKVVGGLNIADSERHYSPAGQWWAAVAGGAHQEHFEVPDRLKKEWIEPFGDRRQAIAFMGIELDSIDLTAQLNACLLSDTEMAAGEGGWATLSDPFPNWAAKTHEHECEDHDCCHH